MISGGAGAQANDSTSRDSGGGGGGAGRIRINAVTDAVMLGTISPALTTNLATLGSLLQTTTRVLIITSVTDGGSRDAGQDDAGTADGGAADAGVPQHHDYAVGCDCQSGPGLVLLWLAGLAALGVGARRQRRW